MNLHRVLHVGSFKSVRELEGPRQLRQTVEQLRGGLTDDQIAIECMRVPGYMPNDHGPRLMVRIETPYEVALIAAFPIT